MRRNGIPSRLFPLLLGAFMTTKEGVAQWCSGGLILLTAVLPLATGCSKHQEVRGCFVAGFERFEFRNAETGVTYYVVGSNKDIREQLVKVIGNEPAVAVPMKVVGVLEKASEGVGPNGMYRESISVKNLTVLDDPSLCK
jgi:hypothetical protein